MRWFNSTAKAFAAVTLMLQDLSGRFNLVAKHLDEQGQRLDVQAGQLERQAVQLEKQSGQLEKQSGQLEKQEAQMRTALGKMGDVEAFLRHLDEVLESVKFLASALHVKGDTLQSSYNQARVMLENVERLGAALHPKADTLQASQSNIRETVEASYNHARDAASSLHNTLQALMKASSVDKETLSNEIDRLDLYLNYHAKVILNELTAVFQQSPKSTIAPDTLYTASGMDAILSFGEFDVVVPTREIGLLGYLRRHGMDAMEPAVRAALRRHLRAGHVAIDAGANIGLHSIIMAQAVGPEGRLIAFEPLPHLAAAVSRSLLLNGFAERCTMVQAALADAPGEAVIHAAAHSPVSSMFARDGLDTNPVTVPRTALDAYIQPGGRVDLIKMDIEGAEPLAWAGMARVVAENPDLTIILEWSASHFAHSGHSAAAFMRDIQAAGFSAWRLRDDAPDTPVPFDPLEAPALEAGNLLLRRD